MKNTDVWSEYRANITNECNAFMPLYPYETETRSMKDISGLWKIVFDRDEKGEKIYGKATTIPSEARTIAVPGSFNDQFTERELRDYVGAVWYYRYAQIPDSDNHDCFLRFGSANYFAKVFIEGECIGTHSGGHLPFTLKIPDSAKGKRVLLCVMVDNTLSWETIPPGQRHDLASEACGVDKRGLEIHFDFFHYAGLHRKVYVLETPKKRIVDFTIRTLSVENDIATLSYNISVQGDIERVRIRMDYNGEQKVRFDTDTLCGEFTIAQPILWDVGEGNLYDFYIDVLDDTTLVDRVYERIGIRTIEVNGNEFLLNGKPVYFKGFGRHEDFIITGRNIPDAVLVHDFELMKWIGANSFRTSHYPYSEETMHLADEMGFLVIDETPAVGLFAGWGSKDRPALFASGRITDKTLAEHRKLLAELIARDKNRPSVVMWSISNEASTKENECVAYFKNLAEYTRVLDPSRPITNVLHGNAPDEKTIGFFDVICLNKYIAWYEYTGEPDTVDKVLGKILDEYYEKFKMPLIMSEFGADTIAGMHRLPGVIFSEEYQDEYLQRNFEVFDKRQWVIGEHIWNFADFMTKQGLNRVIGNRKGIFTRERHPKLAAHTVRKRWRAE